MSLKSALATFVGKSSYVVLHDILRRGGTSLPGKLATKIDPEVMTTLAEKYDVILITGTNGKTLTTTLTTRVLREQFPDVITNPSGSNMMQGITGTMLTAKVTGKSHRPIALLEVDEANVEEVARQLKPMAFVLTNIFRDQLDRFGEIYTTYDKILKGIRLFPEATVIANADSPIFMRGDLPNPKVYYGFNHLPADGDMKAPHNTDGVLSPTDDTVLHYHFMTFGNQGDYFSVSDDFKRPELDYAVTKINEMTPRYSNFDIDGETYQIEIGGMYNIYNALAAYTVGRFLGVTTQQIHHAFESNAQIFGRQEAVNVNGKEVTIVLIKNPVGANQVIDMMKTDDQPFSLIALLNANYADGIDTSWIWDTDFESLKDSGMQAIATGGERYKDLYVRVKMAGYGEHPVYQDLKQIVKAIDEMTTKRVYIAATYTAMLQLRAQLAQQGFIKTGMGE
ncbi:MurT ligase domain-containing protein [Weissella cibaria]|uniref:MurT ligase domain-containing protein n=1 Tax=Weissella cibaria TaxID=137591 RepID=UPI001D059CC9|nr:MurT ligase domain-containing protein [Weissella cibaria]MCB5826169.1 MurT ligase domain-containing protein [Weissella cibaria]MCB5857924.1 MurT ligase domain-containing protein [Weissella cibaria]MCB5859954.1 MurT ligase domain-containing protein [Weissella cibaria]MCB5862470.1 MurT ligase domain-containing protein [Weissella cibaria]MCB5864471.1 MurT ligase domain-containing protein [Weissella cibaria]